MEINSNPESIRNFQHILLDFCSGICLEKSLVVKINLAIEEILINIISYAYAGNDNQKIFVDFEYNGNQIKIVIKDMGPPFNINEVSESRPMSPFVDKIGGWGIHIVRSIMDKIEYTRMNDYNVVSLFKNVNSYEVTE